MSCNWSRKTSRYPVAANAWTISGNFINIELEYNEDRWCKTIDVPGVDATYQLNNLENESEHFNECNIIQCSETYRVSSNREELKWERKT